MKKLLVAAAAAVLALTSCSTGFVANDSLDTPDLKAVATENGVIVLSWDSVKDATNYNLQVKEPGTEEFKNVGGASVVYGRNVATYNYYAPEKDYEFKLVVTSSTKANLVASETSVSVTTPEAEAIKDTAFDGSKIAVTKKNNSLNAYNITFPVDAGFNYKAHIVKAAPDAKAAFAISGSGWVVQKTVNGTQVTDEKTYNGANYITKLVTVKNAEGEEEEVAEAPWIADFTVPATDEAWYVVVKAEPKNPDMATVKYAISTASAKFDYSANTVTPSIDSATKTSASTARIKFTANKVNNAALDASKFTVYRSETKITNVAAGTTVTTNVAKLNGAVKVQEGQAASATDVKYYYDDAIAAYSNAVDAVTTYTYYVVCDDVWSSAATIDNTAVGATTATALADAVSTGLTGFSVTESAGNTATVKTVDYEVTAKAGAAVTINYATFKTEAQARAWVQADLVNVLPTTKVAGSVTTYKDVVDGVEKNVAVAYDKYKGVTPALETAKSTTTGTGGDTTVNAGTWYVVRAKATLGTAVTYSDAKLVYVTENKTTNTKRVFINTL